MDIGVLALVYILSLIAFFAVDMVWLTSFAKNFYAKNLSPILRKNENGGLAPRWIAGIIFYLVFIIGIIVFAAIPAFNAKDALTAIWMGALFGFISYATYDLTNYSTLKDFPKQLVYVDLAWGTFISTLISVLAYFLFNVLM